MLPINPAQIKQEEQAMTAPKPSAATSSAPKKTVATPATSTADVASTPIPDAIVTELEAGIMKNPAARTALALVIGLGGAFLFVATSTFTTLFAQHLVSAPPVWLAVYSAVYTPVATVGGFIWKANIK